VVSALTAIAYLRTLLPSLPLELSTILLLTFFYLLTNYGISESAGVAKVIFLMHIATLSFLCLFGVLFMLSNMDQLWEVRLGEERSDKLQTPPQAAKTARAHTLVQDVPPP